MPIKQDNGEFFSRDNWSFKIVPVKTTQKIENKDGLLADGDTCGYHNKTLSLDLMRDFHLM